MFELRFSATTRSGVAVVAAAECQAECHPLWLKLAGPGEGKKEGQSIRNRNLKFPNTFREIPNCFFTEVIISLPVLYIDYTDVREAFESFRLSPCSA
jgi:hypothetical protein